MRVVVLASGSGGNATLIEAGSTRLLVDAGIPPRTLRQRLKAASTSPPKRLDAILITHAHGDHARYALELRRSFDARLLVTRSTAEAWDLLHREGVELFGEGDALELGEVGLEVFALPHDTPQVGLRFAHEAVAVALATDLGVAPEGLLERLDGCRTVLLESNHDSAMLTRGPYPPHLKRRVASELGHLSNDQAAELLGRLGPALREVVLMHLSETNNRPELALSAARRALKGRGVKIVAAQQRSVVVAGSDAPGQLELELA